MQSFEDLVPKLNNLSLLSIRKSLLGVCFFQNFLTSLLIHSKKISELDLSHSALSIECIEKFRFPLLKTKSLESKFSSIY